ncbi:MAG TPA: hypothetical protein DCM86_02565 [Verrucomicrobiales bacterium]|nr:hypothetical protein [Verrucomicrobiales bacterium]
MAARQPLLLPDPRPLVERLGIPFFQNLPDSPGVYLMHAADGGVLYVGKARSLRQRLRSYRVANPDRMPRRHLRLLRAVERIELQLCADEQSALREEARLLLALRPRFNRAGTWRPEPSYVAWRAAPGVLELGVITDPVPAGWTRRERPGGGRRLASLLARLLWLGLNPEAGVDRMPEGWFHGPPLPRLRLRTSPGQPIGADDGARWLDRLLQGEVDAFSGWIREGRRRHTHPFEMAVVEEWLQALIDFFPGPRPAATVPP